MENTTATEGGMSKMNMILLAIAVFVIIGIGVLVFKDKLMPASQASGGAGNGPADGSTAGGNDFVSGATVNKRTLSNYKAWEPGALETSTPTQAQKDAFNDFWGTIASIFGNEQENQAWIAGFLKGMNLAVTAANVRLFKNEITAYLKSDNKLRHWEVEKGQFLK